MVEKLSEPLGLDRWTLRVVVGPVVDATACCDAWPEYRLSTLSFDVAKLQTGDELDEIIVHEMTHCHTWALHTLVEDLGRALAESAPKQHRAALAKLYAEQARLAGEDATTQIGFTFIRLYRRWQAALKDVLTLREEVKTLKRRNKELERDIGYALAAKDLSS